MHKKNYTFIETCPAGCDCQDFATCNWSIYGAAVIETTSQNTTEWINTARKILEYTCNDEMHAVCCCGPEQLAPDFRKPKKKLMFFPIQ